MKTILFNFKTYVDFDSTIKLANRIGKIRTKHRLIIAPPTLFIHALSVVLNSKKVELCAQDFDYQESYGAHTGDVLIEDLKDLGCRYVLIGHSEVRNRKDPHKGDSEELVGIKTRMCLKNGLTPVLCFGEKHEEKEAGIAKAVISRQLDTALDGISRKKRRGIIFAYEPVWALSSTAGARRCDVGYAERMAVHARKVVGCGRGAVLYGGSVDKDNITDYISNRRLDGVLVGRAGTDLKSLGRIAGLL
ncbi:MAG: triose-phosphate isomerase [Candidatus Marsarchaeota archaeon]|nr:triose-phosphate isomerase [Candidatus Marsarchaeota archaeon]MCL5412794.1 triose-phosphate isomerase [Candidatus Marsarchaeota archaeon]